MNLCQKEIIYHVSYALATRNLMSIVFDTHFVGKKIRQNEYFVDKKSKIFRQSEFRQKEFRQSEW